MSVFKVDIDRTEINKYLFGKVALRQFEFATSFAMNNVANTIRKEWQQEISFKLDNPSNYFRSAPRYKQANKKNLNAIVYIDRGNGGPRDLILFPLAEGGKRGEKPFERQFRRSRLLKPGKQFFLDDNAPDKVPGIRFRIKNAKGDLTKTSARKIAEAIKNPAERASRRNAARMFYSDGIGGLPAGVWAKGSDRKLYRILVQTRVQKYKGRLRFNRLAQNSAENDMQRALDVAIDRVLK